jgi:hypothetical protein
VANRRRVRELRDVQALTLARISPVASGAEADVTALVTGLSSLLQIGIHFAFYPDPGVPRPVDLDFAGNEFSVFGWTSDERGQSVQLDSEPVSGATPLQAPAGWSGRTELDGLEVRAHVSAIGTAGEWRLIVVLEPGDGTVCECFEALAQQVTITPGTGKPVLVEGA